MSELLFHEQIPTSVAGAVAYRIRYRSHDLHGRPTESTGLVIAPVAPGENRRVVSWAHGTTGLGDAGSPSAQPDPARELTLYFTPGSQTQIDYGIPGLQQFINDDWVVVATDYQGLGSAGVHQYTVNRTNGIEAITALGGDISSTSYPHDDHFSLPQSAIDEAYEWLAARF